MNIAETILTELKAKVVRAIKEGKAEDFYFDEADREALKALIEISEKTNGPLPNAAVQAAVKYNLK